LVQEQLPDGWVVASTELHFGVHPPHVAPQRGLGSARGRGELDQLRAEDHPLVHPIQTADDFMPRV
jgi:hypothetical protein